jgi:hypothetical protein
MGSQRKYIVPIFTLVSLLSFIFIRKQNDTYQLHEIMKEGQMLSTKSFVDSLSFSFDNNLIILDIPSHNLGIKESNKIYHFLVDTGSPCFFSEELIKALGLERKWILPLGIDDDEEGREKTDLFTAQIKLQNLVFQFITIGKLSKNKEKLLSKQTKTHIHGIIGANLMQHCLWQIDYVQKKIYLSNQLDFLPKTKKKYSTTFIRDICRRPCIYLTINHFPRKPMAILSTGNPHSIVLNQTFKSLRKAMLYSKIDTKEIENARSLIIGDLQVQDVPTFFEGKLKNYLGNGFGGQYTITIDWKSKRIWFGEK